MANRIVRVILRGEIADLQAKMAVAAKSVGDTADKMTNASKESVKFRQGLTTLGSTAGKVGLVAAAGLGLAVAAAARFDSAMSKVEAATHESAANMELLRAAAIKAGADTVFSATEAADAITALAKAGVATKDILGGGLAGALSLASAGELDVASAAEIAATAMTQFGLAGKDIPHISDLLAASAGKAQGEVTDMAAALKYVGPVAHQMGISIEETTGAIAELASQGILGEQAGTSLRGMLTSLTSPSALAAKTMQNLGITLYDATGNFVGLRGVAGQLHDTMGNLTNAERDQALGRIFGNEQITAARILYAGGAEAVDKWTRAVDDQGYAAETAAIKMDNLSGDLEQLKGSFETALIGLGEGSQGPLRELVQGLTNAVNAFNEFPGPVKNATVGLLGITAITGGALWFGSKVITGIADTRLALEKLGVQAGTTRTALSGISKGLTFFAILEGLNLLDAGLDKLMDTDLNTSKLATSLDDLAKGHATGEIADKYGADLEDFGRKAKNATGDIEDLADGFAGLSRLGKKLPLVGGFASGSVGDDIDNMKKLDEALTGLVQSGNAEEAAAVFAQFEKAATDAGVSVENFTKLFPQYTEAAISGSAAAHLMSDALDGLIPATDGTTAATGAMGAAVQQSTADLAAQAKALEESRKAANDTAHEFFGLGESLNDSKVSLHDWITDLHKQTVALRDFMKNAETAGKRGLRDGLIAELQAAGPEGALRMKQLADASQTELRRANREWSAGQRAIDAYTDAVGGVPPAVATTVTAKTDAAMGQLNALGNYLFNITRPRTVTITAVTKTVGGLPIYKADGGTIPHAAAGWTVAGPRQPYGDKVLAYLAPGEEVITNRHGEADRFRADRAAGRIPAYANGMPQPVSHPVSVNITGQGAQSAANGLLAQRGTRDALLWAFRMALRETPVQRVPSDLMYGMAS